MKKIFTLVAVAALAVTMVACGNKAKKAQDAVVEEVEVVEEEVVEPTAAAEESVLDKYEKLVNQAIEVYPKVKAGDATALTEYTKISEDMQAMGTELTNALSNMTPADVERFTKLGEKWAAAAAQ